MTGAKLTTTCTCCGSDDVAWVGAIPSAINFAGRFLSEPLAGGALLRCSKCFVSFRYPQLDKKGLDELYRQGKTDNWQAEQAARSDWQIAGAWLSKYLKSTDTILDIGCFDGGFLRTIETTHGRFGIEIHEEAGRKAEGHGIQIIGKDFSELGNFGANFDAVTSFDVIEHSQNPLEFLGGMVKATNDGGIIILSTGNSDALSWKLLGSRYWYCTIGEHLSFISPKWCEWAANQLGLELKQVTKFSHARATWRQRTVDFLKNLLYAASPRGFAMLRKFGLGGSEYRISKVMLSHPPHWMSAKDHFVCIFTKK